MGLMLSFFWVCRIENDPPLNPVPGFCFAFGVGGSSLRGGLFYDVVFDQEVGERGSNYGVRNDPASGDMVYAVLGEELPV